jgi:hypothetical protein
VHSTEGNTKEGKHYIITNPDDLFKLGIVPDLDELKLQSFV